jgi:cholesterol oxidase
MSFHYSKPFESLLGNPIGPARPLTTARVVIVGSGYGGAVAAYRLAATDAGKRDHGVVVLERGREYALGEFPMSMEDLPGCARGVRNGRAQADSGEESLFDLHIGDGVDVLVGSGLGGTSLINANVAYRPTPEMLQREGWPKKLRQEAMDPGSSLMSAFDQVERWLTETNLPDIRTHSISIPAPRRSP